MNYKTSTHSSKSMLETAIEAAKRAGQVIAERYPSGRTLTHKGYRDIVTDADTAAEAIILNLIHSRFPEHTVISEEAGAGEVGNGYTWIVDPLDGTTNYAHHVPIFAVSIGVLEKGDFVIGVVHDPLRDQTFTAERGKGAWFEGAPMHVSDAACLDSAVIGLDWGRSDQARDQVVGYLQRLAPRCRTLRGIGTSALAMAYVAAGWLDAYFHPAIKCWDAAAGELLVLEAGGQCTTLEGTPYRMGSSNCLATNGLVHDRLLSAMRARQTRANLEATPSASSRYAVDKELSLTPGHA
jgi:myo-inositol-1(or 4)-monophosphatase